jgi:putative addiction module component (TIGR02574 family)
VTTCHHAERDDYIESPTVIDSPVLRHAGEDITGWEETMTTAQSIVVAARELPEGDRILVIEALLDRLEPLPADDPEELAHAWREELAKRSHELRTGAVKPVPWPDICAEGGGRHDE